VKSITDGEIINKRKTIDYFYLCKQLKLLADCVVEVVAGRNRIRDPAAVGGTWWVVLQTFDSFPPVIIGQVMYMKLLGISIKRYGVYNITTDKRGKHKEKWTSLNIRDENVSLSGLVDNHNRNESI
jgi:hypothetical protein